MEAGLRKNEVISELTRSEHGNLLAYIPTGRKLAEQDPEFLAHLIAWNQRKGAIRDTKLVLPLVAARFNDDVEYNDNAYAHLLMQSPRELLRAARFTMKDGSGDLFTWPKRKALGKHVEMYLRAREEKPQWFDRTVLQHRRSMKALYALFHIRPAQRANEILFGGHRPGVFKLVSSLKDMDPLTAAGTILRHEIPLLTAEAALGKDKLKDPAIVMALMDQMSPAELISRTKQLEALGVKTNPMLRAAYQAGLKRVAESADVTTTLKTTKAASVIQDEDLADKLRGTQEKQLKALGGVDGDWLVLGDRSGSMAQAIDLAKEVAAVLARMVKGKVHLIFFDTSPRYFDVTGKTLDEITALTRGIREGGGTSIGCGLQYMLDKGLVVQGIAVISDAAENSAPYFADVYKKYAAKLSIEPTTYLYRVGKAMSSWSDQDLAKSMSAAAIDLQEFNLSRSTDYYSLPNLVQTMRTSRYSLIDEIMETPLLTVKEALKGVKNGSARKAA